MSGRHEKDRKIPVDDEGIPNCVTEYANVNNKSRQFVRSQVIPDDQSQLCTQYPLCLQNSRVLNNDCGDTCMTRNIDSKRHGESVSEDPSKSFVFSNMSQFENKILGDDFRTSHSVKRPYESFGLVSNSSAKRNCCTVGQDECEEQSHEPSTSNSQFDRLGSRGFDLSSEIRITARRSENHSLPLAHNLTYEIGVINEVPDVALKLTENKYRSERKSPPYCVAHSFTMAEMEQAKKLEKDENLIPFFSPLSKSRAPSSAVSPESSYGNSVVSISKRNSIFIGSAAQRSRDVNRDSCFIQEAVDSSGIYIPGVDLLIDDSECEPIDLISRFSRTPISSPKIVDPGSTISCALAGPLSSSHIFNQLDSNVAQRRTSSAATSSLSAVSAGMELSKATKERCAQLRQRRRAQPTERQPLPALHLHLSKDGTSPLPPGWQRAPNTRRSTEGQDLGDSSGTYAYYYYHVRTRQTRWDPPVYPWDADPTDTLLGETGEDDPEAPYNWGCASRFAVTHEEIEAMYNRVRQRILERQCIDLLHELAGRPDAPQDVTEQGFAMELFTLVHNTLRGFRDARCKLGRIVNDEDLYYLTKKLAQAVILKEIQKFHQAQAANTSLFSTVLTPELPSTVRSRVTTYVRRYMESKGAFYRRRVQLIPATGISRPEQATHLKPDPAIFKPSVNSSMRSRPVTHPQNFSNVSHHTNYVDNAFSQSAPPINTTAVIPARR
ncbi:unnamed protein product [Schistosoma bovis]|nr:unnamed protein product [Schistosoma bovis]CAH8659754.1 unnamed protein product [Schistosoma bovis]